MRDGLKPPQPFIGAVDAAKEWPQWREHFKYYMKATKKTTEDPEVQVATLLTAMGKEAISIYQTFKWVEAKQADDLDAVLSAFSNYFKPKTNEIYERFTFLQRKQRPSETFETFYTDLLRLVNSCAYHPDEISKIIRDQIVMSITSDATREKLLHEADLDHERAVEICRSREATTTFLTSTSAAAPPTKDAESLTAHAVRTKKPFKCQYCGQSHLPRACPAWGKPCTYCNKLNHLAEVCRKAARDRKLHKTVGDTTNGKETANALTPSKADNLMTELTQEADRDHFVYVLTNKDTSSKEWTIILDIQGRGLTAKVDTGASCNVMSLAAYQVLCKAPPQPTTTQITAYGGTTLDVRGKTHQVVIYNGTTRQFEFILVRENVQTLLGLPSIRALGLLHETCEVTDQSTPPVALAYSEIFEGLGQLPGEHHIKLRHDAQPVIQAARRVPFKYRQRLQKQLQEMVEDSIITPVTEATDWVSPIVLVTKPRTDKLRICIDPGELNKAIHREHYQIKTPEEIFGSLSGTKYFTTLDATSGFLQITLDPESSYLTTFATPFGRYR